MALKVMLETLEGVDDAVKALYTEADGKFALALDGVDSHPDVENLKSAYERTKELAKTEKAKVADLQRQIEELGKGKPNDAEVLKLRQALEAERDGYKQQVDALHSKLIGVTRDTALHSALADAGVINPTFVKAATAMLAAQVKMDGDRAVIETDMGPMALADHIKRWAAGEGKDFVSPAKGSGAKSPDKGAGAKTMTRSAFDALSATAKADAMRAGFTLT